jgi:WhiB family redox-sensing transcriptional regulator
MPDAWSAIRSHRGTPEPVATIGELPCRTNDIDLWFAEHPTAIEQAKALCAECPIKSLCLAGARERKETAGVWGGQLFVNGVVVARKRPRGRPRKYAA